MKHVSMFLFAVLVFLCSLQLAPPLNAAEEKKPGELLELTVKDVKFRFRWCPAGTFTMGSPPTEEKRDGDETAHPVTLSKGFWMAETEITQEQWEGVWENSGYLPKFKGTNLPMEYMTWIDCQKFIAELSKVRPKGLPKGYKFALPTEAQWEYACRAGSRTAYCFGNDKEQLGDYAWYGDDSGSGTHPVGTKKPNAWNLYDMHGNVWEWCEDRYDDYPTGAVTDPKDTSKPDWSRVSRGGSWNYDAGLCRSAKRDGITPLFRSNSLGFRLSLVSE